MIEMVKFGNLTLLLKLNLLIFFFNANVLVECIRMQKISQRVSDLDFVTNSEVTAPAVCFAVIRSQCDPDHTFGDLLWLDVKLQRYCWEYISRIKV